MKNISEDEPTLIIRISRRSVSLNNFISKYVIMFETFVN